MKHIVDTVSNLLNFIHFDFMKHISWGAGFQAQIYLKRKENVNSEQIVLLKKQFFFNSFFYIRNEDMFGPVSRVG